MTLELLAKYGFMSQVEQQRISDFLMQIYENDNGTTITYSVFLYNLYEQFIEKNEIDFQSFIDELSIAYPNTDNENLDVERIKLCDQFMFYSLFVRPLFSTEDITIVNRIDERTSSILNETLKYSFDVVYFYDALNDFGLEDNKAQISLFCKMFFDKLDVKLNDEKFQNGNSYVAEIEKVLRITYGESAVFNGNDFIIEDIKPLDDKFFEYMMDKNIVKPIEVLDEIQNALAYVNVNKKHFNTEFFRMSYLRKYDVPLTTEKSKEYLNRYIIPLMHDNLRNSIKFYNYGMFGMHHEILNHLIKDYRVKVVYGSENASTKLYGDPKSEKEICVIFHDIENNDEAQNFMMMMGGQPKKQKTPTINKYYKTIEFHKDHGNKETPASSVKDITCEDVTLNTNPSIYSSMLSYVMKNVYNFSTYSEIKEHLEIYVDEFSSKFRKISNNILNNSNELCIKIKKRYDDTVTNIVDKFIDSFKKYLVNYIFKPAFAILIYGAPGTGKTYFAQTLARIIYGSDKNLFTLPLSNYSHVEFLESYLFGSTHGFIGSDQETDLQKFLNNTKETGGVILIDEVDKVSNRVNDVFLNILNDGKISFRNMHGGTHDIRKYIFIFCGNFNINTKSSTTNIKQLSPALLDRMKLQFKTKNSKDKKRIVESVLNDSINRIISSYDNNKNIDVEIDDSIMTIQKLNSKDVSGRRMGHIISEMFINVIEEIINICRTKNIYKFKIKLNKEKMIEIKEVK